MGKKVLSIDISNSLIKVCEVDYKSKNTKVYDAFTLVVPDDAYDDQGMVKTSVIGTLLKSAIKQQGIRTKQAVFVVNSQRIANREVMVPFVKEKQIRGIIEANANEYFPVDVNSYQISYCILGIVENAGVKQYRILVLAVPKENLEQYYSIADAAGLSVLGLDYSGHSILPVVAGVVDDYPSMIIKLDEEAVQLTIMKNKEMVLQRTLGSGVGVAMDTMVELPVYGDGLNALQSVQKFRNTRCFLDPEIDGLEPNYGDEETSARFEITDSIRPLVSSIVRVIEYYNSRNANEIITDYFLTGLGANFVGLSKLIADEIKGTVEGVSPDSESEPDFDETDFEKPEESEEKKEDIKPKRSVSVSVIEGVDGISLDKNVRGAAFGEYATCVGAAMAHIDLIPDERNPKKKKKTSGGSLFAGEVNMTAACAVIMAAGIVIAGGMFAYAFINHSQAFKENTRLNNRKQELQPVVVIHDNYSNASKLYTDIVAMYDATQNPNENIVAFLTELQDKLPKSVAVSSFVSTRENVTMSLSVSTKEAVGKTLEQFRTFESIEDTIFDGASESVDGMGAPVWTFTITGVYKPMDSVGTIKDAEAASEAASEAAPEAAAEPEAE